MKVRKLLRNAFSPEAFLLFMLGVVGALVLVAMLPEVPA